MKLELIHPVARQIELEPLQEDGRWMGDMFFDVPGNQKPDFLPRVEFRVEAYALDSVSDLVVQLREELENFAECGDALQTITIDGRECYLVVMPKGR